MKNLSVSEYAELISKALEFLKEHKISQNSVSDRINYYSLSKAKNSKKYPQKIIEGKSRFEILNTILSEYELEYDKDSDAIRGLKGDYDSASVSSEMTYYVLYYFSTAKQIVGKGLVSIKEKKWTTIDFNDPNHTLSFWKGTFEVVENYTFLYVEKRGDTTPVKALYSFFSGTIKHGRPVLIGTYSTIKRDGSPTAGNVVMEKVTDKEAGLEKINTTTNPSVTGFLFGENYTIEAMTPPTINDLPKRLLTENIIGNYQFYWPYKGGKILNGNLSIKETSEVIAVFENLTYHGLSTLPNNNTLYIVLKNSRLNRNLKDNNVHAYININNYNDERGVLAGILITPNLLTIPASFPILLAKKNKKISNDYILKYFSSFSNSFFTAIEPLELDSVMTSMEN